MAVERFFVEQKLAADCLLELSENEFHHLSHVLRCKVGDRIELVDGQGNLAFAIIQKMTKNNAQFAIEKITSTSFSNPRLILAQALPKPNRLDFILEKGTELGVQEFWLFPGELSVKKEIFPNQIERARALTIAAMKQCGRLFLPKIIIKPPLKHWNPLTILTFFGDVNSAAPLLSSFQQSIVKSQTILLIIGPESGFNQNENNYLLHMQAQGVKLHQNILRTDTASIMGLSLLSHWLLQ